MAEEYNEIGPSINNMDFYIGGVNATAYLSIELTQSSSAIKIAHASSTIAISLSSSQSVKKIAYTNANSSINLSVTISAVEIVSLFSDINITSSLSVSSKKIAFASSNMAIGSSLSSSAMKESNTSSEIHIAGLLSTSASVFRVAQINAFSITLSTAVIVKEILTTSSNLEITSRFKINPPIKFTPGSIDSASIRSLFFIDGKPLTNHNRVFDESLSLMYVENINWNNKKNRYYRRSSNAGRKSFNLSWTFLPNYREFTVDNRYARDFIAQIAEDPDVHVFKIVNQDENGTTVYSELEYNVFVRSYSESLIRRDMKDNVYYFDCSLSLEEA